MVLDLTGNPTTLQDLKKSAAEAVKKAEEEIINKFGVDYSHIKLENVHEFVAQGKNLQAYGALPIL